MTHRPPQTFARFVATPQNRSALVAAQGLSDHLCAGRTARQISPLFLHGPSGTGKTHLASALAEDVTRRSPTLAVAHLPAAEFPQAAGLADPASQEPLDLLASLRQADLLILEDLQHLPAAADEALVQVLDERRARGLPVVCTAAVGPQALNFRQRRCSARLASRLAAGLVVRLTPLPAEGRLAVLRDKAQRRQLAVHPDVLAWLAEHLPGGVRQLEGALTQLELLARLGDRPLDVATVAAHFRAQAEASRLTVERIAERVSGYFQVAPQQLQSRRRQRRVLLPRQVGMYLARQLTDLSLEQIGSYFGGRDHSTVLHACRKVEQALHRDAALSGAVRQLQADLA